MSDTPIYSIKEMAELGGVSRRTVRYYVQRGLIPTPTGTGRGKHYTQAHLDALIAVRTRQESGESLDAILASMEAPTTDPDAPHPRRATPRAAGGPVPRQSVWTRIAVDPSIEIHVRNPRALDAETAARVAEAVRQALRATPEETS